MPRHKTPLKILQARMRERSKRWREANPERNKRACWNAVLKKKYGITAAEYEQLLDDQEGGCAICHSPDPKAKCFGNDTRLHVDHDHATGTVRGLLCHPCNTSLGAMGDSPARLRRAATYLEAHYAEA